jgi:hypothetical protein
MRRFSDNALIIVIIWGVVSLLIFLKIGFQYKYLLFVLFTLFVLFLLFLMFVTSVSEQFHRLDKVFSSYVLTRESTKEWSETFLEEPQGNSEYGPWSGIENLNLTPVTPSNEFKYEEKMIESVVNPAPVAALTYKGRRVAQVGVSYNFTARMTHHCQFAIMVLGKNLKGTGIPGVQVVNSLPTDFYGETKAMIKSIIPMDSANGRETLFGNYIGASLEPGNVFVPVVRILKFPGQSTPITINNFNWMFVEI